MKRLILLGFILLFNSFFLLSQNAEKEKAQRRITQWLDARNALSQYYALGDDGIKIFSSLAAKSKNISEFEVTWQELEAFKSLLKQNTTEEMISILELRKKDSIKNKLTLLTSPVPASDPVDDAKPLKGKRIAIDAGHMAGDLAMGEIEQKYLYLPPSKYIKDTIRIVEGRLTYATALVLKERLENRGAKVFMTRNGHGLSAFGVSFHDWKNLRMKRELDSLVKKNEITPSRRQALLKASDRDLFQSFFRDYELRYRARVINDFHPDATLIIHYNVNEKNVDWKITTDKNYTMAFVGGGFFPNDLSKKIYRFQFLRMAISNDLDASVKLSYETIKQFENSLKIPSAKPSDATYLFKNSMFAGKPGVYCRNLYLTRMIHGPVVYGESLYQDNHAEAVWLNKDMTSPRSPDSRILQVADAYLKATLEFFK